MSLPERREPDGVSVQPDQVQAHPTGSNCVAVQTNISAFADDSDELCQRLSDSSIGEESKFQDIPVCLHQGQQGGSPVLITLPFQNPDTLQTFVPCDLCHHPGMGRDTVSDPSDALAFCVCEVNIQTGQLTLVPCFLCWQPSAEMDIPNKITVPLFPTSLPGNDSGVVEPEVRFVPCALCLQPNHCHEDSLDREPERRVMHEPVEEESFEPVLDETTELDRSWFVPFSASRRLADTSLQMAFILRCGNVIRQSRQRLRAVPTLAKERQNRVALSLQRRNAKYFAMHNTATRKAASKRPMNFTHNIMRKQTERIYKKLPEVKENEKQRLKESLQHTYKLMAYIFQKRLQRATLQGKVSWQITESCM